MKRKTKKKLFFLAIAAAAIAPLPILFLGNSNVNTHQSKPNAATSYKHKGLVFNSKEDLYRHFNYKKVQSDWFNIDGMWTSDFDMGQYKTQNPIPKQEIVLDNDRYTYHSFKSKGALKKPTYYEENEYPKFSITSPSTRLPDKLYSYDNKYYVLKSDIFSDAKIKQVQGLSNINNEKIFIDDLDYKYFAEDDVNNPTYTPAVGGIKIWLDDENNELSVTSAYTYNKVDFYTNWRKIEKSKIFNAMNLRKVWIWNQVGKSKTIIYKNNRYKYRNDKWTKNGYFGISLGERNYDLDLLHNPDVLNPNTWTYLENSLSSNEIRLTDDPYKDYRFNITKLNSRFPSGNFYLDDKLYNYYDENNFKNYTSKQAIKGVPGFYREGELAVNQNNYYFQVGLNNFYTNEEIITKNLEIKLHNINSEFMKNHPQIKVEDLGSTEFVFRDTYFDTTESGDYFGNQTNEYSSDKIIYKNGEQYFTNKFSLLKSIGVAYIEKNNLVSMNTMTLVDQNEIISQQ